MMVLYAFVLQHAKPEPSRQKKARSPDVAVEVDDKLLHDVRHHHGAVVALIGIRVVAAARHGCLPPLSKRAVKAAVVGARDRRLFCLLAKRCVWGVCGLRVLGCKSGLL